MQDKLTCIMCPLGCEMDVAVAEQQVSVMGNKCVKGLEFAKEEMLDPRRNLATSVPIGEVFQVSFSAIESACFAGFIVFDYQGNCKITAGSACGARSRFNTKRS